MLSPIRWARRILSSSRSSISTPTATTNSFAGIPARSASTTALRPATVSTCSLGSRLRSGRLRSIRFRSIRFRCDSSFERYFLCAGRSSARGVGPLPRRPLRRGGLAIYAPSWSARCIFDINSHRNDAIANSIGRFEIFPISCGFSLLK